MATKKERLDEILAKFMQVGQIKAIVVVSREGLLITSTTPPNVNERIVAALCSTVMASAETASVQMKIGEVSEITVRTSNGTFFLRPAGKKAVLIALAETNAQLGLIAMEMETRADQVKQVLEEL
ncbi:MAG: roadblock/LC7 domain-containing protein [Halobacteria archaeon]